MLITTCLQPLILLKLSNLKNKSDNTPCPHLYNPEYQTSDQKLTLINLLILFLLLLFLQLFIHRLLLCKEHLDQDSKEDDDSSSYQSYIHYLYKTITRTNVKPK